MYNVSYSCRRQTPVLHCPSEPIKEICLQVWALLAVDIPVAQQEHRRVLCSKLLRRCFAAHAPASPRLELSADRINLHQVLQPCIKVYSC